MTNRPPIRWMTRRDMPEVIAIEHASHDHPWCEEEFLRALRQRNCIGMVAEHGEKIVGFMIYELHREKIAVLNFAVHPEHLRQRIGAAMIAKLTGKLSTQRRSTLEFLVRETSLGAQLFLRACRLLASDILREHFPDSGEDAYRFTFTCDAETEGYLATVENLTGGWA